MQNDNISGGLSSGFITYRTECEIRREQDFSAFSYAIDLYQLPPHKFCNVPNFVQLTSVECVQFEKLIDFVFSDVMSDATFAQSDSNNSQLHFYPVDKMDGENVNDGLQPRGIYDHV